MGPDVKDFVMTVRVERSPYHGVPASHGAFEGALSPALYREPDRLVPLSGVIKEIADKESEGRASRDEKIHAFYDYVYRTMTYNKDGTGWGRGDAIWACTNKRGNCTDFHSLLIGMLRSQDIPARFLIGFPVPDGDEGDVAGYHCWAEIYDDKHGWVPVDASEAKKKNLKDAYFGTLPNDRIEFTLGRDLVLAPPQKGEPLNYFIYPYAEIDGRPTELQKSFHFRRLEAGVAS
jgi:transglutaminase-like putative cysteine protease